MAKKLPKVEGFCVATVMPLKERTIRPCGQPADKIVDGRTLCRRHANYALMRKKSLV